MQIERLQALYQMRGTVGGQKVIEATTMLQRGIHKAIRQHEYRKEGGGPGPPYATTVDRQRGHAAVITVT